MLQVNTAVEDLKREYEETKLYQDEIVDRIEQLEKEQRDLYRLDTLDAAQVTLVGSVLFDAKEEDLQDMFVPSFVQAIRSGGEAEMTQERKTERLAEIKSRKETAECSGGCCSSGIS